MNKKEMICYNSDASRIIGNAERVIFPKTREEVIVAVKLADLDIVPRGSGTGLVGGCVADNSLVIDMSKMNKVSKFDPIRKTVCVEAGTTLRELNEKLEKVNFEFPFEDFNKGISSVGGLVALNFPGFRSMKYGRIRDWIDEMEIVNGKGELVKINKNDLMDVCGMEGTTGIITSLVLKIIPKKTRTASIFQASGLEEILSIARRLKSEKEVTMLEFFPPQISKLLKLPEKYHIIIEFDSQRGKITGEEYKLVSQFKNKVYGVLYSEGYFNSEDPRFFFDKIKDFVQFLETNKIPYFGYLDVGIIHPFFKDDEIEKRKNTVEFMQKLGAKPGKYGVGIVKQNFIDSFEKKVLQRVKLRYDPAGKLNKDKFISADFNGEEVEEANELEETKKMRVREIELQLKKENEAKLKKELEFQLKEETRKLEEIKRKEESKAKNQIKTPDEKMKEFIKEVEIIDKISEIKKPLTDEHLEALKERKVNEMLKDYEQTFESELVEEKRRVVEDFAFNLGKPRHLSTIEEVKKRQEPEDYKKIQNIMTNKFRPVEQKPVEKSQEKQTIDISKIMTNNYSRDKVADRKNEVPEKKVMDSEKERELIDKIMSNNFGLKNNKENKDKSGDKK